MRSRFRAYGLIVLLACGDAAMPAESAPGPTPVGATACEKLASLAETRGCAHNSECAVVAECDALGRNWIDCVARDSSQCTCESGGELNCGSSSDADASALRCAVELEAFRLCQEREHPETDDPAAARVGDRCLPQHIPESGFSENEAYLEGASPQCGGDACLVFRLEGDPRDGCVPMPEKPCAAPEEVAQRVYCTCRCYSPDDSPECACPDDFTCVATLDQADAEMPSGYCVRSGI